MVMLSKLRRFDLVDDQNRRAKLNDLIVTVTDGDYPPVTHLLFYNNTKQLMELPWAAVKGINWRTHEINIRDLKGGKTASPEMLAEEVLLRRDIQDAMVLDLLNRRATRANDLWLEERDGQLQLRAADTSSRAVLRRLTRGLFGTRPSHAPYDWKYVEFLRGDPQAVARGARYYTRIHRLPPGEIARLADALPYLHAAELLTLLPDPIASDTLEAMSPERQLQVFEELDEDQALRLLALMAPDIATDLVGRLQSDTARRVLERLPKKQGDRIIELLRYPEDVVGGIMTNDVVCLPKKITVEEARRLLHHRLKEPDFVYLIYIVEDEESKRLCGMLSLRTLLIANDEQKLEKIMDPYVTTLNALEPADAAAYRVINSHLAALPVTGREGQLLGTVTVDAAVARVAPPNWTALAPRVFS
jgi:CBS domain-containing protein